MYLLVSDHRFHIAINDEPYCTYNFRQPIDSIKTLEITKDVQSIHQVDHRSVFPSPYPSIQVDEIKKEFSNDVPRRFTPGIKYN